MAHVARLATVLLLSTLAACGGRAVDSNGSEPHSGGSGAQGGKTSVAGNGGAAGKGGTVATGGVGSAPGGSGGTGAACSSFTDEPGTYIDVEIINETSTILYLGQPKVTCEVAPLFEVQAADGTALPSLSRCRSGCGSGVGGCTAICLFPSAFQLVPGASHNTSWDGLFDVQVDLPQQCIAPDLGSSHCQKATRIEPGTFTFSALAGTGLDCSETQTVCACNSDDCVLQGATIDGAVRRASTTVLLDASYGISPKNLPAPGGSGAPAGNRAFPTVRIVFKD